MGSKIQASLEGKKMRICPKCGYEDPFYWRQARHRYVNNICQIADLEMYEPELAKNVKTYGRAPYYFFDGTYYYRLTKANRVERTHRNDLPALEKGYYEKSSWKIDEIEGKDSRQKKLSLE